MLQETGHEPLPLVCLSYHHIHLPRLGCLVCVQGYIRISSLTEIAFLNCKVYFRVETRYLLNLKKTELSRLSSACGLHQANSKYCL